MVIELEILQSFDNNDDGLVAALPRNLPVAPLKGFQFGPK